MEIRTLTPNIGEPYISNIRPKISFCQVPGGQPNLGRQLELFRERLPYKPYCTDDLHSGLRIAKAASAVKKRYIQHNPPMLIAWIVVDGDEPGSGRTFYWDDRTVPAPNIVAENPDNLHAHLFYGLQYPVSTKNDLLEGSSRAFRYCAAVEHGLVVKLQGDPAYVGLMSKNPLSPAWDVRTYCEYLYTLDELADYVDLGQYQDRRRKLPEYGYGRNCTLFDYLRLYAYRKIKDFWGSTYEVYFEHLEEKALLRNMDFPTPMYVQEVGHIVKSVARWTWKHFNSIAFSDIQKARNRKSQVVRKRQAAERRDALFDFMEGHPGATNKEIAEAIGVTDRTIRRYREGRTFTISGSAVSLAGLGELV